MYFLLFFSWKWEVKMDKKNSTGRVWKRKQCFPVAACPLCDFLPSPCVDKMTQTCQNLHKARFLSLLSINRDLSFAVCQTLCSDFHPFASVPERRVKIVVVFRICCYLDRRNLTCRDLFQLLGWTSSFARPSAEKKKSIGFIIKPRQQQRAEFQSLMLHKCFLKTMEAFFLREETHIFLSLPVWEVEWQSQWRWSSSHESMWWEVSAGFSP